MIDHDPDNLARAEGQVLKQIRLDLGKKQTEMASLLGMHYGGYQKWEQGQRGVNLTMEQVVLLDRHLATLGKRFSDYWLPAEHESPN
jgi:transcriptional regulator with XRE-family HTH domain